MSKKVGVYLENPSYFQHDLNNQKSIWMDNLVRPLSSHYEATLRSVKDVFEEAARRRKVHEARLAKIDAIQGIVLSLVFAGLDICSAAALKKVSILSRYSNNKGLEHFLAANGNTSAAVKQFLEQPKLISDTILGNLDDRIRGLAQTGTVVSAYKTVEILTNKVQQSAPKDPSAGWPGEVQFKSRLETFYSSTARSINEAFVEFVRDGKADREVKRQFVEYFVHLPFLRPPTLSMVEFQSHIKDYYETCYWCDFISGAGNRYRAGRGQDGSAGGSLDG